MTFTHWRQRWWRVDDWVTGRLSRGSVRARSAAFSVGLGLLVAVVALQIGFRRPASFIGEAGQVWQVALGGAVALATCSYLLQRAVGGEWQATWPGIAIGKLAGARFALTGSVDATPMLPMTRAWCALAAWGWCLQLRVVPDGARTALVQVVAAHVLFGLAMAIGERMRGLGQPSAATADRRGWRETAHRQSTWVASKVRRRPSGAHPDTVLSWWSEHRLGAVTGLTFGLGCGLLLWVLAKNGAGEAAVSATFAGVPVQPTELGRPLLVVAFTTAVCGARPVRAARALAPRLRTTAPAPPDEPGLWDRMRVGRIPVVRMPGGAALTGIAILGISAGLLYLLRDLSPALVMGVTFFILIVTVLPVARIPFLLVFAAIVLTLAWGFDWNNATLETRQEQKAHPLPYTAEVDDPTVSGWEEPYQLGTAMVAMSRAGVDGTGPGRGIAAETVPVAESDFILAVLVEEWGVLGVITVVLLYAVLFGGALRAIAYAPSGFAQALIVGLASVVGVQLLYVLLGMGLVLPHGGLTVPLLSAGGSSLLVQGLVFGAIAGLGSSRMEGGRYLPKNEAAQSQIARRVRWRRGPLMALSIVLVLFALVAQPLRSVHRVDDEVDQRNHAVAGERGAVLDAYARVRLEDLARSRDPAQVTILSADGTTVAVTSRDEECDVHRSAAVSAYRCYPRGSLYEDVVGHVVPRGGGRTTGYEAQLRDSERCVESDDLLRVVVGEVCRTLEEVGLSLLDPLHEVGATHLRALVADADPAAGPKAALMVADPATGTVEALLSAPATDPNLRSRPPSTADEHALSFGEAAAARAPDGSYLRQSFLAALQHESRSPSPGVPRSPEEALRSTSPQLDEPISRYRRFLLGDLMGLVTGAAAVDVGMSDPAVAAAVDDGVAATDVAFTDLEIRNSVGRRCGGPLVELVAQVCTTGFAELAYLLEPEPLEAAAAEVWPAATADERLTALDGLNLAAAPVPFEAPAGTERSLGHVRTQAVGRATEARGTIPDVVDLLNVIATRGGRADWRLLDPGDCQVRTSYDLSCGPGVDTGVLVADAQETGNAAEQIDAGMRLAARMTVDGEPWGPGVLGGRAGSDAIEEVAGFATVADTGPGAETQTTWCTAIVTYRAGAKRTFALALETELGSAVGPTRACQALGAVIDQRATIPF